jgi:hypothetical protein
LKYPDASMSNGKTMSHSRRLDGRKAEGCPASAQNAW